MLSGHHTDNSHKLLVVFMCGIIFINFDRLVLNIPTSFPHVESSSKWSVLWYNNGFYCNTYWTVLGMGIGLIIDFSYMFPVFIEAKMRSGLYPFFHLVVVVVCLPRPMEGMGRRQFSDLFFTELPVPPQAAGVVGTFNVLDIYPSEHYGLLFFGPYGCQFFTRSHFFHFFFSFFFCIHFHFASTLCMYVMYLTSI